MQDRNSLYDNIIERLKNNKVVVWAIIGLTVATGVSSFIEFGRNIGDLSSALNSLDQGAGADLKYVRVKLKESEWWEEVPRDYPNHLYEQSKRFVGGSAIRADELEAEKRSGKYICPSMFAIAQWCARAEMFFSQKGLQNKAIDPVFDVTIKNSGQRPAIVTNIGVEIAYAGYNTVSLGDWETRSVLVKAKYEVEMPYPSKVEADGMVYDVAQELEKAAQVLQDEGSDLRLKADPSFLRALFNTPNYEWSGLPIPILVDIDDPLHVPPDAPYRMEVILKNYNRMPNNVVIRFLIRSDAGISKSSYIYLLAM
jgi:hypothetical protein